LPPKVAEALEGSLSGDPECEWVRHDEGGSASDQWNTATGWDVVFVGGDEILLRGYDWLENLSRMTPDQPIIVVVAESGSDVVGKVLEAGATECLLECEVGTGFLKEAIREAMTQKGIEKEVRVLSSLPMNAPVNDRLTGLMSSEMAEEFLDTEFRSAVRGNRDIACLLVQAAGIDEIGELFGTAFSNIALREVGESLKGLVRHADVLSRLSGAEFVVVLPGANVAQAVRRGRQIVQSLMRRDIVVFDQTVPLRVRVGVTSRKNSNASRPWELVEFARQALNGIAENEDGSPVSVWP
jgi:diguanylate cyclase (GGDEF)-like protein